MKIKILALVGPTAVGKTKYAISLAEKLNGEIVSADSVQIYKDMIIGSARPSDEELSLIPHYLIDMADPFSDFTVVDYKEKADEAILTINKKGKLPIISGGTGLYLNSLVYDMGFNQVPVNQELRDSLYSFHEKHGAIALHKELEDLDKEAASKIHPNNIKRVVRAIEIVKSTGKPMAYFENVRKLNENYDFILIALNRDRDLLYNRINKRVDIMMEKGLLDEVRSLVEKGLTREHYSMMAIGYKELIAHLEGEISLKEAVDKIKQNSRNYAKRQLTWFKRYEEIHWFNLTEDEIEDSIIENIVSLVNAN